MLYDIIQFRRGKNITSSEMLFGEYPVISAGIEPSGFHNKFNVKAPSITISSSGANAGYLSFHKENIWAADCSYATGGNNIYFAYYLLKFLQPVITNLQRGAAQPHVYAKDVNALNISISNVVLNSQDKIANILQNMMI